MLWDGMNPEISTRLPEDGVGHCCCSIVGGAGGEYTHKNGSMLSPNVILERNSNGSCVSMARRQQRKVEGKKRKNSLPVRLEGNEADPLVEV